jgi:hypothetical protein
VLSKKIQGKERNKNNLTSKFRKGDKISQPSLPSPSFFPIPLSFLLSDIVFTTLFMEQSPGHVLRKRIQGKKNKVPPSDIAFATLCSNALGTCSEKEFKGKKK